MNKKGQLFLIPTPLGEDTLHTIPNYVIDHIHRLDYFIVEKAKTARRFIKATGTSKPIQELTIFELNKFTDRNELDSFLDPVINGFDMGLMSEAGCPGVADPGAVIVEKAHQKNIRVVPLVGPSSILLALMASGLNGQNFAFHGYLSVKKPQLIADLKKLEKRSFSSKQTQIFIEAPYRNKGLIETALTALSPKTHFCIAAEISTSSEYILTRSIQNWKKETIPDLHKRPVIYLIGQRNQ